MDATKWTQGFQEMIAVKPLEQMVPNGTTTASACTTTATRANNNNNNTGLERKARPQEKLNCPRCNSTNTKFCYYNNYSLTQPRYFCKACRRYWTEGGSLRNVPVGGSSRKNKRSSAIPTSSAAGAVSSATISSLGLTNKLPDLNPPILFSNQNPKNEKGSQDLNMLSFPVMQDGHGNISQFIQMPKIENNQPNPSTSSLYVTSSPLSAMELLRTGVASRGLNAFMPTPIPDSNALYSSGFSLMHDYKPNNLSFANDGLGHHHNRSSATNDGVQVSNVNGGRVLFPFGEMKQLSSTTHQVEHNNNDQHKSQGNSSTAYWSGMFSAGGSSW